MHMNASRDDGETFKLQHHHVAADLPFSDPINIPTDRLTNIAKPASTSLPLSRIFRLPPRHCFVISVCGCFVSSLWHPNIFGFHQMHKIIVVIIVRAFELNVYGHQPWRQIPIGFMKSDKYPMLITKSGNEIESGSYLRVVASCVNGKVFQSIFTFKTIRTSQCGKKQKCVKDMKNVVKHREMNMKEKYSQHNLNLHQKKLFLVFENFIRLSIASHS